MIQLDQYFLDGWLNIKHHTYEEVRKGPLEKPCFGFASTEAAATIVFSYLVAHRSFSN